MIGEAELVATISHQKRLARAVLQSSICDRDAEFADDPVFYIWAGVAFPDEDLETVRRAWIMAFTPPSESDIPGLPKPLGQKRIRRAVRSNERREYERRETTE